MYLFSSRLKKLIHCRSRCGALESFFILNTRSLAPTSLSIFNTTDCSNLESLLMLISVIPILCQILNIRTSEYRKTTRGSHCFESFERLDSPCMHLSFVNLTVQLTLIRYLSYIYFTLSVHVGPCCAFIWEPRRLEV